MIIVEGNYKISKPAHRPSFPAPRVHVPPPLPPRRQRGATNLQQLDDPLILPHRYKSSYISPSCPLPPGSHSVIRSSCLFKLSLPLFFYFYFIFFLFFILFSLVDLELNHCRFRFLWLLFPRASSPFIARVAVRVYLIYCDRILCLFVVYLTVCFLLQFAFALLASSLDFPVTVG